MKALIALTIVSGFVLVGQSSLARVNGTSVISPDSNVQVAPSAGSVYAKENDPKVLEKPCAFSADGQGIGPIGKGASLRKSNKSYNGTGRSS